MNLLIVDDEYYSVENLKRKLIFAYPQFETIFCAYNITQALDIYEQNEIAILICDIEMPGGSGLDLLERIRQKKIATTCIFLTAYAKFEYISQALRLSSIDYLLKPVLDEQLFSSIDKAILHYQHSRAEQLHALQASYWKESELSLMELFWMDLLAGTISSTHKDITNELHLRKLPPNAADSEYLLVMIQCGLEAVTSFSQDLYEFILKNIVREYFYDKTELPVIVRFDTYCYLLPLPAVHHPRNQTEIRCREALKDFTPRFPNSFNFYIAAAPCTIWDAKSTYLSIKQIYHQNVFYENRVFDLAKPIPSEYPIANKPIPAERWTDFLLRRQIPELESDINHYIHNLKRSTNVTRESLSSFYYGFLRLLLGFIERNNQNITDTFFHQLSNTPVDYICSSFNNLQAWIQNTLMLYEDSVLTNTATCSTAVTTVKAYIREHINEQLDRTSLSAIVYLNPDYLSHIFKKETGVSLSNYIISERIAESKRLLSQTNMSIRDIAISCGFENISYFSKQFKKATGISPRDFRK